MQRLWFAGPFLFLELEGNRKLRDHSAQASSMQQRLEAGFGFVHIFLRILNGCSGRRGRFRGRCVGEYLCELSGKSKCGIHTGNVIAPALCARRLEWTVKRGIDLAAIKVSGQKSQLVAVLLLDVRSVNVSLPVRILKPCRPEENAHAQRLIENPERVCGVKRRIADRSGIG